MSILVQSWVVYCWLLSYYTTMRITTSKVKNAKQLNYTRQQTSFLRLKKSIKTDLYYLFKQKKEANKY